MKKMKNNIIGGLLAVIAILAVALFVWLKEPKNESAYAEGTEKTTAIESEGTTENMLPNILLNGEKRRCISLTDGHSVTVELEYEGNLYVPTLSVDADGAALIVERNVLTVKPNAKIGWTSIKVLWTVEGEEYIDSIEVEIQRIIDLSDIFITDIERTMTVNLPDNVEYIVATVTKQDVPAPEMVTLHLGDVLNEIFADVPHKTSGLSFTYVTIGVRMEDYSGREVIQPLSPSLIGIEEPMFTTNSLSGSGSWLNPYKIYSQSDFLSIPNYDNHNSTKYFKQMQDMTFSTSFTPFDFYGDYYGTLSYHKITLDNLTNPYAGLFKINYGTIRYLKVYVDNLTITTTGLVGIICSENYNTIRFTRIYGNDYGTWTLNPIISWFPGTANTGVDASQHVIFAQDAYCGVCTGKNNGTIADCEVTIKAYATKYLGGIAYSNTENGQINYCVPNLFVSGVTESNSTTIGGVVAYNFGNIIYADPVTYPNISYEGAVIVLLNQSSPTPNVYPRIGGILGVNYNQNLNLSNYQITILVGCYLSTLVEYPQKLYINELIGRNY